MVPHSYEVQVVYTAPQFFRVEDARFCPGGGFVVLDIGPDMTSRLLYCNPEGLVLEISQFGSYVAAEIRSVGQGYVVVATHCFVEDWRAVSAYSLETSAMLIEVRFERYETGLTLNLETGSCVVLSPQDPRCIFSERDALGNKILGELSSANVNRANVMPGENGELLVGILLDSGQRFQCFYVDPSADSFREIIRHGLDGFPSIITCPFFFKGEPRVFPGFVSGVDGLHPGSTLTIWDVELNAKRELVSDQKVYFPSERVIRQGEGGWISVARVSPDPLIGRSLPHFEACHVFDSDFNITKVDCEQPGKSLCLGRPTDLTPEGNVLFTGVQDRIPVVVLLVAE